MALGQLPVIALFAVLASLVGCDAVAPLATGDEAEASDQGSTRSRLVETDWLNEHLDDVGMVVIDARPTAEYLEKHVPGAVSASFSEEEATSQGYDVSYGGGLDFFLDAENEIPFQDGPPEQIQAAVRGFGINQDSTVVVYDNGAHFHSGRFFWTLMRHGFDDIYVLNGGLGKWEADGYATTQDVASPAAGNFVAQEPIAAWEATTDDVFAGLSDPNVVLVSGLPLAWHHAALTAYTVPGHIPGTKPVPLANYFDTDLTWKSAQDVQVTLDVLGITPDKAVITYCGGGPLSGGIYFTFKHVLGYPNVRNYAGSYIAWITDPRDLPVNTYGNDHWLRDTAWCSWWVGERMQRLMPSSPALAVDVRTEAEYEAGHIPWSVNISMDDAEQVLSRAPSTWAARFGDHGLSNDIEVVAVDDTLTPRTTLLFWLLQYLGHENVSIASEGLAGWQAAEQPVSTEDTVIADASTPIDVAIQPATFTVQVQAEIRLTDPEAASDHPFSRVWVVSAEEVPDDVPVHTYRHVPWTQNLTETGELDSAGALSTLYEEAEVPYFSEIICYSDDPAEATMTFFVLRMLGYPRVAVYIP